MEPQEKAKPLASNNSNSRDNVIFIGSKPLVNYVKSVVMQFRKNNSQEVIIKSRGKFISKAVDIAEVARRRYLEQDGVKIKEITKFLSNTTH